MKRRINVRGVIINNKGELFCQKLTARNEDSKDFWSLPGGGLESGESIISGLKREMIEETGVAPVVGDILFIQQFASQDKSMEFLEFFFHISNWQDYQNINLNATTHGLDEVTECGFINPETAYIMPDVVSTIDFGEMINKGPLLFDFLSD